MLFAAGFGTRMGALSRTRPKPLIEVAGVSLLDHALALADAAGTGRKVINVHYLAEQIAAHTKGRADISLSWERGDILDTGGGLRAALPLLWPDAGLQKASHDTQRAGVYGAKAVDLSTLSAVMTLNTDAVWRGENPLDVLAQAWDPARMDVLLLLLEAGQALGASGRSDFVLRGDGALPDSGAAFGAMTGRDAAAGLPVPQGAMSRGQRRICAPVDWARGRGGYLYLGAQIIAPHMLEDESADTPNAPRAAPKAAFSLREAWERALAKGRAYGVVYKGAWCDVGHPGGIALAEEMLRNV